MLLFIKVRECLLFLFIAYFLKVNSTLGWFFYVLHNIRWIYNVWIKTTTAITLPCLMIQVCSFYSAYLFFLTLPDYMVLKLELCSLERLSSCVLTMKYGKGGGAWYNGYNLCFPFQRSAVQIPFGEEFFHFWLLFLGNLRVCFHVSDYIDLTSLLMRKM